jgi:siroheme synthase-like protein
MAPAPHYPVNLVVEGRSCLVVGGGAVATEKARELVACGAEVHVVATEVGPGVRAIDGLAWEQRPYRPGEAAEHRLVIAATDDPEVNRQVHRDADAAGVWVNSADDPANCTFLLPSRIRQGPVLVTFSTAGEAPAVSRWLRRQFQEEIGPEYAMLVELVSAERERLHAEGRTTMGLDWQAALDSGMLELIREGRAAEAEELLRACLSSSSG